MIHSPVPLSANTAESAPREWIFTISAKASGGGLVEMRQAGDVGRPPPGRVVAGEPRVGARPGRWVVRVGGWYWHRALIRDVRYSPQRDAVHNDGPVLHVVVVSAWCRRVPAYGVGQYAVCLRPGDPLLLE